MRVTDCQQPIQQKGFCASFVFRMHDSQWYSYFTMMRNRTTTTTTFSFRPHQTATGDSSSANDDGDANSSGSSSIMQQDPSDKKRNLRRRQQSFFCAALVIMPLLLFLGVFRNNEATRSSHHQAVMMIQATDRVKPDWSLYENCTLPTITGTPKDASTTISTKKAKPLFTPSFPTSLDDQILRNTVHYLTGAPATVKAYYAQSRKMGLRHCYGGETITLLCTLIHPLVPLSPSPDSDKYTSRFHSTIVMPLRNPATVFPAFLQSKAEKYHQQQGQVPVEQWRRQRDESLTNDFMQQYRRQITEWNNNLTHYHTALYLPYEHMMEPSKGPQLVQKLAQVLLQSGFDNMLSSSSSSINSLTEQEYTCIWYHSVGADRLRAHHDSSGYAEYPNGYLPSYTKQQYQYMAQQLEELIQESSSSSSREDLALVQILQEYQDALRHPTHIDVEATPE